MESGDVHELARGILHQRIARLLHAHYEDRAAPIRDRDITWMHAYDRDGKLIETLEQFVLECEKRKALATTVAPTGFRISTVWVGDSENWLRGVEQEVSGWKMTKPIIFETAKFRDDKSPSADDAEFDVLQQYTNQLDAMRGHASWVEAEHIEAEKESDGRKQTDS